MAGALRYDEGQVTGTVAALSDGGHSGLEEANGGARVREPLAREGRQADARRTFWRRTISGAAASPVGSRHRHVKETSSSANALWTYGPFRAS
jgi:hypothetical protein